MSLGVLGFLVLFVVGLVLVLPLGRWIDTRLLPWPDRPMDNQEMRAGWALKYHQATPIQHNTWRWPWVERHGTGIQVGYILPPAGKSIETFTSTKAESITVQIQGNDNE